MRTAARAMESSWRIVFCRSGGNESATRETVEAASVVCTVEKTRWPVSAAASAMRMVSGSRISPTTITSGAWRIAARSAVGKSGASMPISTCSTRQFRCGCSYSIGILDRDDVARVAPVDLLDERGERGRLSGARGSADEHEAAGEARQRLHAGREAERGETRRLGGERADGGGGAAALAVEVDPETAQPAHPMRGVGDPGVAIERPGVTGERGHDRLLDLLAGERAARERTDLSVDAHRGRRAGHEQEVASRAPDELLEPGVEPDGELRRVPDGELRRVPDGSSSFGRLEPVGVRREPVLVQLANELVDVGGVVHGESRTAQPARCQSVCGALFSKIQPRKSRPYVVVFQPISSKNGRRAKCSRRSL